MQDIGTQMDEDKGMVPQHEQVELCPQAPETESAGPEKYRSKAYAQAAQDVALEAMILNLLSNSNIIKLKGCRLQGLEDSRRVS